MGQDNGTKRHFIVETSDVKSTKAGHIFSVKDADTNMDNGELVKIDKLIAGETEVFSVKTPAETDKGVVLINTPALMYDTSTTLRGAEYNFYNEAGSVARAYELVAGDRFGVSIGAVTLLAESIVVGNYVVCDGARKYKEKASVEGTEGFVAQVMFTKKFSNGETRVYLRVIQN